MLGSQTERKPYTHDRVNETPGASNRRPTLAVPSIEVSPVALEGEPSLSTLTAQGFSLVIWLLFGHLARARLGRRAVRVKRVLFEVGIAFCVMSEAAVLSTGDAEGTLGELNVRALPAGLEKAVPGPGWVRHPILSHPRY